MVDLQNIKIFYGYKHSTLEDLPRCFNVGKGLKGRPTMSRGRNHKWYAIVKRYGYSVEVCVCFKCDHHDHTLGEKCQANEDVCAWEIEQIAAMGTFSTDHSHDSSDIGCNFTKGGEGVVGGRSSDSFRQKIAKSWTDERRQTASIRMCEQNPMKDLDVSRPVVEKLIAYHTGRKRPPVEIEKLRQSKMGSKNPAYGKPQPEEAKRKNAESNRKRALAYWAEKRAKR